MQTTKQTYPFPPPGRYCYTLPVSATGSLWGGYGGWLFRAFLWVEKKRRSTSKQMTIRVIPLKVAEPDIDYIDRSYPSDQLHPCRTLRINQKSSHRLITPAYKPRYGLVLQ
ncbi:hypothetical protein GO730_11445 [Spirosoma sp. HMF3257]|uniref:hypothetical protein n=1 Tax=Spirosoma telluris TaxID=2183553 RepID=UPI000DAB805E|nr:hypothetical protein [Spirosoma telluris]